MIKSFLVAISVCFIGCSTIDIPNSKYIPVKCKIDKSVSPINQAKDELDYNGILQNQLEILSYTEEIENDLNFCIEGGVNENL